MSRRLWVMYQSLEDGLEMRYILGLVDVVMWVCIHKLSQSCAEPIL